MKDIYHIQLSAPLETIEIAIDFINNQQANEAIKARLEEMDLTDRFLFGRWDRKESDSKQEWLIWRPVIPELYE